jgi:hypothetical protein
MPGGSFLPVKMLTKKVPGRNPINNQNKLEFGFQVKHEAAKIQNKQAVREFKIHYFQRTDCGGRGNPAPTLTVSAYGAFGTIRGLFIFVKVGARSPRPHLVGVFSDTLKIPNPIVLYFPVLPGYELSQFPLY